MGFSCLITEHFHFLVKCAISFFLSNILFLVYNDGIISLGRSSPLKPILYKYYLDRWINAHRCWIRFPLKFGLSWKIYFIFFIHIITDISKAEYDLISLTTDQIIHYVAVLIFIENWENNGHIHLNVGKEIKNEVIE